MAADTPVDIKHSGFKSLTVFLKASAKEGLIKIKETKGGVVLTGAEPSPMSSKDGLTKVVKQGWTGRTLVSKRTFVMSP